LPNKNGKSIIGEISTIGCSDAGRIFCIITGSSCYLRQLCFSKLPDELKNNYPNYTGLSLNSTKYSARWIYPFLDVISFEKVVRFLYKKYEKEYDGDKDNQRNLNIKIYLKTGGNPRLMQELIQLGKCDNYTVSLKNFQNSKNDSNYKILEAVYHWTNYYMDRSFVSTPEDLPNDIFAYQAWTKIIEIQQISEKMGDIKNDLLPMIYNLADNGSIRFIDDRESSPFGFIGLGSPLIYFQFATKGRINITPDEIAALKSPVGQPNEEIAENVAFRFIANKAAEFLEIKNKNFQILDTNVQKIVLKYNYTNISSEKIYANGEINQIKNRFFKECFESENSTNQEKDVFGMDGIVIENDELNMEAIIVHRIQLKLGTSNIKNANEIIQRVNLQKKNFERCFNKTNSKHFNYLVTTRGLEENARKQFTDNDWKIVGQKDLSEKIWPEDFKALGKPYR
jgi:Fe-S-cluster formation regulator IscX/YfhJ